MQDDNICAYNLKKCRLVEALYLTSNYQLILPFQSAKINKQILIKPAVQALVTVYKEKND